MNRPPYAYKRHYTTRYSFVSSGKRRIEKIVDFTAIGIKNTYNLAFGDLLPDGSIDDKANSNNGDIVKVLSTVVSILRDFTIDNPKANIVFTGSTEDRTKLYGRILKTYYQTFVKEFSMRAFVDGHKGPEEIEFDPQFDRGYLVFLIKRII